MLKLVEVANLLTNELNDAGTHYDPAYTFNIQAEVGANKNSADVQGIITSNQPTVPPVDGVKNAIYSLSIDLTINAPTTNYNLKNIEDIIGQVSNKLNGTIQEFEDGSGLITMSLTATRAFKTTEGQGNIVPLTLTVGINYTENVVTSGQKKWELKIGDEWVEIPYLSEDVIVEKYGKTNNIWGEYYQKTLLTAQMKLYHFTFLYDGENILCTTLQKDLLEGDATKSYGLRYSDGVTFDASNGNYYTTTVSILKHGDTRSTKPNTATMDITFADVDDGSSNTKYEMALIDNPFDAGTENTRCFDSYQEQIDWYASKIAVGADYEEIPAPNINSLTLTNQVYINHNNYNLFDLLNKDYAIIRVTHNRLDTYDYVLLDNNYVNRADNTDTINAQDIYDLQGELPETITRVNPQINYFYYDVTNAQVGMDNQVVYDLKLDSVQTILFQDGLDIQGSYIQKAHLNRWIDNGDGTVSFDGTVDSKLFEREEITQAAQRLVSRHRLQYHTDATSGVEAEVVTLINGEHGITGIKRPLTCWCYIYISPGSYTFMKKDESDGTVKFGENDINYQVNNTVSGENSATLKGANGILCYPVYPYGIGTGDANNRLMGQIDYPNETISINRIWANSQGLKDIIDKNDQFMAKVRGIKLSMKPPFPIPNMTTFNNVSVDSDVSIGTRTFIKFTGTEEDNLILHTSANASHKNFGIEFIRTSVNSAFTSEDASVKVFNGIIAVNNDYNEPTLFELNETGRNAIPTNTFTTSTIRTSSKNTSYNPKLNAEDYKTLRISMVGNEYSYPINKLNDTNPIFEYFETLSPDVTNGLLRYRSTNNNAIFNPDYSKSYNGFAYTNDFTFAFNVNQYESFIANNKNFYKAYEARQNYSNIKTYKQMAKQGLGLFTGKPISAALGMANTMVSHMIDLDYENTQKQLTLDNMRSAPEQLQNANGNAAFAQMVVPFGIYVEIYSAIPHELAMANEIMFREGYTYNINDDNIFNYINASVYSSTNPTGSKHIRKNFNYVKAFIGNLSGLPMSNTIRNDLRQRFMNGIRFWHKDDIDYDSENYEKWLNFASIGGGGT